MGLQKSAEAIVVGLYRPDEGPNMKCRKGALVLVWAPLKIVVSQDGSLKGSVKARKKAREISRLRNRLAWPGIGRMMTGVIRMWKLVWLCKRVNEMTRG